MEKCKNVKPAVGSGRCYNSNEMMKSAGKNRAAALIAVVAIVGILFGASGNARAAAPALPFGGRIIVAVPGVDCVAITIGPPRPGIYVLRWGVSFLYRWWQVFKPGTAVLGLASIPVPCFMSYVPPVFIVGLFIVRMGTSN